MSKSSNPDLEGSFTQWMQNKGYAVADLTKVDYMKWFEFFIRRARERHLIAQVFFANKNIEESILRDVNLKKHYTTIDKGILPSLQYFKTMDDLKDQFIKIDKNDAATLREQMSLDKGYARGIFENMEEKGYDIPEGAQLITSDSLFRNYVNDFSTQGPALESVQQNIRVASSEFWGIPVMSVKDYDSIMLEDFTKEKAYVPHFALLAHKSNILIGVDPAAALEDLTFEYVGGADEYFYVKGKYRLDVKIANPLELVAAF